MRPDRSPICTATGFDHLTDHDRPAYHDSNPGCPAIGRNPNYLTILRRAIALAGIYLVNVAHNWAKQIPNELQKGL